MVQKQLALTYWSHFDWRFCQEPVLSNAYICAFKDLQIQSVLIDEATASSKQEHQHGSCFEAQVIQNPENPRKEAGLSPSNHEKNWDSDQVLLDFETKSLRDTRDILTKADSSICRACPKDFRGRVLLVSPFYNTQLFTVGAPYSWTPEDMLRLTQTTLQVSCCFNVCQVSNLKDAFNYVLLLENGRPSGLQYLTVPVSTQLLDSAIVISVQKRNCCNTLTVCTYDISLRTSIPCIHTHIT